jgi:excisionase family DNA binding protein
MDSSNQQPDSNQPTWMTVEQVAVYLSVSPGTVRNWVSQKYIPHAKKGRIVRFNRQAIDAWLSADSCPGRNTIAQKIL